MIVKNLCLLLLLAAFFFGCTPRAATPATSTPAKPGTPATPADEGALSPCKGFKQSSKPDFYLEEFVLYRDFIKAGDWAGAFEKWKDVYANAPAADGKRSTVFTDGVRFYERFIAEADDPAKKEQHVQEIFKIYDEMEKCFGDGGHVAGLKAFDYFFKYPERLGKQEQYSLFKKSVELDGGKPRYFILNPFTSLLVDLTLEEKVPVAEAQKYRQVIQDAVAKGLAECQGKDCDNWKTIAEYAPARLEALESIEGFYDCAYFTAKYFPEFEANPTDCDVITTTYSRLSFGKCPEADAKFERLKTAYNANCREAVAGPSCRDLLTQGKYRQAIACFEEQEGKSSDNSQKAQYSLVIAKIYYAYLKNFPKARQHALAAARQRGGWGEPHLLIGTLYASSGPICGPGRGWDSQVVVWPAIDMWQKAKSIDPGVAAQANKLIAQYTQYMPGAEEVFQRNLKEGAPFFVGCWIQENTTIRGAK